MPVDRIGADVAVCPGTLPEALSRDHRLYRQQGGDDLFRSVGEALYDEVIRDADIEAIKHVPIWFTHAKDDLIVKPEETVVPTYKRLMKAGAKNVHFSFFDKVVDLHGLFTDEKGEPFTYFGHFSWIYTLNDDCRLDYDGEPVVVGGKPVSLMEWLAMQSL